MEMVVLQMVICNSKKDSQQRPVGSKRLSCGVKNKKQGLCPFGVMHPHGNQFVCYAKRLYSSRYVSPGSAPPAGQQCSLLVRPFSMFNSYKAEKTS